MKVFQETSRGVIFFKKLKIYSRNKVAKKQKIINKIYFPSFNFVEKIPTEIDFYNILIFFPNFVKTDLNNNLVGTRFLYITREVINSQHVPIFERNTIKFITVHYRKKINQQQVT